MHPALPREARKSPQKIPHPPTHYFPLPPIQAELAAASFRAHVQSKVVLVGVTGEKGPHRAVSLGVTHLAGSFIFMTFYNPSNPSKEVTCHVTDERPGVQQGYIT